MSFEKFVIALRSLDEISYQHVIVNYFREIKHLVYHTHGPGEHGADVIMYLPPSEDFLGRGEIVFIQIKQGDIALPEWHRKLNGQLTELYCRNHRFPNISRELSRRIVLITSGSIKPEVVTAINDWNERLPIPIEFFDGRQMANMIFAAPYRTENIEELRRDPYERE